MSSSDCPIYILAGGESRRFGSDKARAIVGGRTMIRHVVEQVGGEITVVARECDAYADLGFRTIADRIPGRGPLSAIHAAVCDTAAEWIVVVSCDLLGVRREWMEQLLAARTNDVEAVAFKGEFWQPMPGVYRSSLRHECEERLNRAELSLQSLLAAVRSRALPLPDDWRGVVQANTPHDLREFQI